MTPAFTISFEDSDLTALIQQRLISLQITDNTAEQTDSLTIELADGDRKMALPDRGGVISVALGYKGNMRDMGKFILNNVSIEGPPDRVTLGATSAPFTAAGNFKPFQTRKSRSFDDITFGNIVATG